MTRPDWLTFALQPDGYDALRRAFPEAEAMAACPQDALYHAEGDVWTHTRMVGAALEAEGGLDELPQARRDALRLTALFHDVAKSLVTEIGWCDKEQRERVRQPGHAPLGAKMAWHMLVDAGAGADLARRVFDLVFWHQRPAHILDQNNAQRRVIGFSVAGGGAPWEDLLRFCRADNRGRISPNLAESLEGIELLSMFVAETGEEVGIDLNRAPWPFENAAARIKVLRDPKASPFYAPPAAAGSRMILMSGLPGAGKDTLIRERFADLPVVSMDDIRAEMRMSHGDNQGKAIQAAFEAARAHLREGRDFVWNMTSLSRFARQKICQLVRDYDGAVEAHAIDLPLEEAQRRNAGRANPIPREAIEKMAQKREPILPDEVEAVWSHDGSGEAQLVFGKPDHAPILAELLEPQS
jgi:predicted kinase